MRRDDLYLADIVAAAAAIAGFLNGVERAEFLASDLLQSAVLQKLSIIGEAAGRLSPELRAAHSDVPWKPIIGFRNIAVHAYFSIDWERTWDTATLDVPALIPLIKGIQAEDARRRLAAIRDQGVLGDVISPSGDTWDAEQ